MKMTNLCPPDKIIVLAVRAIGGSVTNNMRMIALGYVGNGATFRFYVEREPTEDELELGEVVGLNFEVGHPAKLEVLNIEFVKTSDPLGFLDSLDFRLFSRWEE